MKKNYKTQGQLDNSRHKEVWVEYNDIGAWIDELLAPVILLMWKLGIETVESCQGTFTGRIPEENGWSKIFFCGLDGPRKFLTYSFQPTIEETQIVKEHDLPLSLPFAEWKMSCIPAWKNGNITFSTSVQFRPAMIPDITKKLQAALEDENK